MIDKIASVIDLAIVLKASNIILPVIILIIVNTNNNPLHRWCRHHCKQHRLLVSHRHQHYIVASRLATTVLKLPIHPTTTCLFTSSTTASIALEYSPQHCFVPPQIGHCYYNIATTTSSTTTFSFTAPNRLLVLQNSQPRHGSPPLPVGVPPRRPRTLRQKPHRPAPCAAFLHALQSRHFVRAYRLRQPKNAPTFRFLYELVQLLLKLHW